MRFKWTIVATLVAVFAAGLVGGCGKLAGPGGHQAVKVEDGSIAVPIAELASGKAKFYHFVHNGKKINFFVVQGADGAVHTAFDTCDACYEAKKGYVQDGDSMVCTNCNQRFQIAKIGPHAIGGCNPSYLPSTTNPDNVVIKAEDVKAGARYF